MGKVVKRAIPLKALSDRQRRIVQTHLPLVHLTLRRMNLLAEGRRGHQERGELLQEGCLALVEAFLKHDVVRHGSFAAFAMSRVHYSMSQFLHERTKEVRVPFTTLRRHRWRMKEEDRHRPDERPRVIRLPDYFDDAGRRRRYSLDEPRAGSPTIGDLVRDRYDAAVQEVIREMRHDPLCHPDTARLLRRCHLERWSVPEAEVRTPIRQLAREMGCSLGRVTHCEERFRRRVAERLRQDEEFQTLVRQARTKLDGWKHRVEAE